MESDAEQVVLVDVDAAGSPESSSVMFRAIEVFGFDVIEHAFARCEPIVRSCSAPISSIPIRSLRTKWCRSWNKAGRQAANRRTSALRHGMRLPRADARRKLLTILCGEADNRIRLG